MNKRLAVGIVATLLLAMTPAKSGADSGVAPVANMADEGASIPVDQKSRDKFPGERPKLIDALSLVNKYVNHAIYPMSDMQHYGVPDKAVTWPDDRKGDCEDYALSKMTTLSSLGVPIITVTRLRFVVINYANGLKVGHAILEILLPNGAIAFLDNRYNDLMTRPELEARGYKFSDW